MKLQPRPAEKWIGRASAIIGTVVLLVLALGWLWRWLVRHEDNLKRRRHTFLRPKAVIALGVASFLTDFSSEMIYPLLPIFLVTVLGAGAGVAFSAGGVLAALAPLRLPGVREAAPGSLDANGAAA